MPLRLQAASAVAALATGLELTAFCSAQAATTDPGARYRAFQGPTLRASRPGPQKPTGLLYVADFSANYVIIYSTRNWQPVGSISYGISGPQGIAVDAAGDLYVSNYYANTITVYPPGQTQPSLTYSTGLNAPTDVAVGSDGTVYGVNSNFGALGNVVEYAGGSTVPTATLTDFQRGIPIAAALDASNNLYVAYNDAAGFGQVNEYAPGATTGTNLGISVSFANGIAIDDKNDVIVADSRGFSSSPSIDVFKPGKNIPKREYKAAYQPTALAIDAHSKRLYVCDLGIGDVLALAYPKGKVINAITYGITYPTGVAVYTPPK